MRLRADQLQAHLSRNGLATLYLISGDEPLQITECIDQLRSTARDSGYEERVVLEVDRHFDWNRLSQEVNNLSLFSSRKIIELRLGGSKPGREGGAALIDYAEHASSDNLLIISSEKLDKKTQQTRWYKALDKAGVSLQVWPVEAGELPAWIQQRFRGLGKKIDRDGAEMIAQRVEGNLMAASQEVSKLSLLVKGDTITLEDVAAAVVDSTRYDVFAMMDAACQGDLARTSRMLYGFRNEGVEPMAIYGAIMWSLRQLATISQRVDAGEAVEQALASQWGLSPKRKASIKKILNRQSAESILETLVNAGRIDRIIKGEHRPLTWSCFQELMASLAGSRKSQACLIKTLTA